MLIYFCIENITNKRLRERLVVFKRLKNKKKLILIFHIPKVKSTVCLSVSKMHLVVDVKMSNQNIWSLIQSCHFLNSLNNRVVAVSKQLAVETHFSFNLYPKKDGDQVLFMLFTSFMLLLEHVSFF